MVFNLCVSFNIESESVIVAKLLFIIYWSTTFKNQFNRADFCISEIDDLLSTIFCFRNTNNLVFFSNCSVYFIRDGHAGSMLSIELPRIKWHYQFYSRLLHLTVVYLLILFSKLIFFKQMLFFLYFQFCLRSKSLIK